MVTICSRDADIPRQDSGVFTVTQPIAPRPSLKIIAHTCGQHSIFGLEIWDGLNGWVLVCCAQEDWERRGGCLKA